MVAFDMDGKVRKPKFELDSEQVRYEHRFAPFNSVMTPPPVHYLQFKVSLQPEVMVVPPILQAVRQPLKMIRDGGRTLILILRVIEIWGTQVKN